MGRLYFTLILIFCGWNAFSQYSGEGSNEKSSVLMVGTDYYSNVTSQGRVNESTSQPSLSTYISWFSSFNLDLSLIGYNVWNSDSTYSKSSQELDLVLGYTFPLTKWMGTSISYSHFFYTKGASSIRTAYSDLVEGSIDIEKKWWWLDLGYGYSMGDFNEFFATAQTGVTIEFDNLFNKGHILSIVPSFDTFFSNMDYYDLNLISNYWYLYGYGDKYPENTISDLMQQVINPVTREDRIIRWYFYNHPVLYRRLNDLPNDIVISSIFKPDSKFDLSTIGFTLPVYYSINDFDISLSYSVYKPVNQPSYVEDSWVSYASVGVSYLFGW